jgi:glycosyltransferase involved in cell wall biosynthesis
LSKPKRTVLILNHSYKSPFKELDIQYARIFNPDNYSVTIVYLTGKPSEKETENLRGYDTIFLNLRKKDIRNLKLRAIRKLRLLCREKRFSVAICHRYKPTYIMYWIARTGRIPILISVMHDFRTLHRLSHKVFVYFLLRHRFIFAGVSDAIREDLYRDGWGLKRSQVITLPNSIDVPETVNKQLDHKTAREQLNLSPEAFVIGTVGRLHSAKDHMTLIHAMALAIECRPDLQLVIIGDGALEDTLRRAIAQHRLEGRVMLAGFIPEASRLMCAFNLYVSSSRKEPFGMVLLEAMAANLPIIATDVDGVPQVMGDCGRLVPPEDPVALAKAIEAYCLRSPEELTDLGRFSRQRLDENFTTEKFRQAFWDYIARRGLAP